MRLLKIGRDASCNIVLNSPKVSALHAEITLLNNGDILLEDKNSTNGTFVMDQPVKPGVQVTVKRGDSIRFANVELVWSQIPETEDLSEYKAVYGIGSNFRNEIQVSGNTVSRFHATLKIDKKNRATLEDHSKNGTTVNHKPVGDVPVQISKGDKVLCGNVPVDLDEYLPSSPVFKIAGLALAATAAVAAIFFAISSLMFVSPKNAIATENAVACVYGAYYYKVTIVDDPFKGKNNWPSVWTFGCYVDDFGHLRLANLDFSRNSAYEQINPANIHPLNYSGTAFFISEHGEMGTNRHVAIPWETQLESSRYFEEDIRNFMSFIRNLYAETLTSQSYGDTAEAVGMYSRLLASEIKISGEHVYFGVGLTGSKVNSTKDLLDCQVICESGDPDKDVALIRLNTRKTPDYLVEMGAVLDIKKARTNEKSLNPQKDQLSVIGYPGGESVSNVMFNGQELHPTTSATRLSKLPDGNQFQVQMVAMGGQSGSPVIDKKHRLVGVLYGGYSSQELTYCCNIKHLKELYDKNKVSE